MRSIEDYEKLKASIVEQHYSPSTKEVRNVFGNSDAEVESLENWLREHPDSILVYSRDLPAKH